MGLKALGPKGLGVKGELELLQMLRSPSRSVAILDGLLREGYSEAQRSGIATSNVSISE